ncbi:thiolase family protein [Comamonas sp. C11]|uniref:thiolase family protein n=1 Tax=Comamonas sp. C11 TaxID=2966554 RepID=UPI00211344AE|nr:thiolase family protein [Comamonas sp. C11]UUC96739.1 thiolase family protein [Comamonas sp. C11]
MQNHVHVVGIGMHRYQFPSETPYVLLGLKAVREALGDAGVPWSAVQAAYVGTTSIGMAAGRVMLQHLGSTGLEVVQVENASASGSFAFRQAVAAISSGQYDVVLAMGVDKHGAGQRAANKDGVERLSPLEHIPAVQFALMARKYLRKHQLPVQAMAEVAVKNHANAARNPYAQFRKERTLEQVLAAPIIVGDFTSYQCCPRGEGAAAVLLMSDRALRNYAQNATRTVRVLASVAGSECAPGGRYDPITQLVADCAQAAYEQAGVGPEDLDLVELHDAFSVEELMYSEAIGLCRDGEGYDYLKRGDSALGGRCAVNPSGGLLGMGHPLGPTGIGQIAEITRQLRGEARGRQHVGARVGMAHMIGLGTVGVAHILSR